MKPACVRAWVRAVREQREGRGMRGRRAREEPAEADPASPGDARQPSSQQPCGGPSAAPDTQHALTLHMCERRHACAAK